MGKQSSGPPLARRVPGATSWPTPVTPAAPPALPDSLLQRMRAAAEAADAVTAPIPVISASAPSDLARPAVRDISARPEPAPQPDSAAQPGNAALAPAGRRPASQPRAPAEEPAGSQAGVPRAPARRRNRAAAAAISALVLVAVGSLAFVLSRHAAATAGRDGHQAGAQALGTEATTRDRAAAWVASQVSRAAVVACDQAMCQALEARGIPPGNLLELRPGPARPLHSDLVVVTAGVRSQLGSRLSSVYAPAVIASFGSGNRRIDVRVIAPHGAAAYSSALRADLLARKASGAELLGSARIAVSASARRQLTAGQVDSRLLIAIAGLAALHPGRIVTFGDSGPGAGAGTPLRSADLAAADPAPGTGSSAYVQSMLAFLHAQRPPYLPARAGKARLASGQIVLRIEFAAPSPLGLLNPQAP